MVLGTRAEDLAIISGGQVVGWQVLIFRMTLVSFSLLPSLKPEMNISSFTCTRDWL